MIIDPEYGMIVDADVGDVVWDDLTGQNSTILRKDRDKFGNVGYWLDNDWVGGGRFPWEISPPRKKDEVTDLHARRSDADGPE